MKKNKVINFAKNTLKNDRIVVVNLINKKIYEIIEVKLIKNETYEELMKFVKLLII